MKKFLLLSALFGILGAAQVASSAADDKDGKPTCPPTTKCPCGK